MCVCIYTRIRCIPMYVCAQPYLDTEFQDDYLYTKHWLGFSRCTLSM